MKIVLGADHGGYHLKNSLVDYLLRLGYELIDVGAYNDESSDYPDFARMVAERIQSGEAERGIMICGSGVGASVAANKFRGIRASVCHDTYSARQGVEDDNMNVLCLGARIVGEYLAREIVTAFLNAEFKEEERYIRRLKKIEEFEKKWTKKG
ncbi:MAG: ribose 5-phosphate isomerase B [Nitrospirae bacterium]|nr:MAG: ribose 5-phosphate isomerase B [Nitrospirota bacterium]